MKITKIFLAMLCFVITFLNIGCSDIDYNANTVVNNGGVGYVAFSAACTGAHYVSIHYTGADSNIIRVLVQNDSNTQVTVFCHRGIQHYLLILFPGKYSVFNMGIGDVCSKKFTPIHFQAIPGKVIYLGRFYITSKPHHISVGELITRNLKKGTLSYTIVNEFNEDITWFLNNYKNIPKSKYAVNILKK